MSFRHARGAAPGYGFISQSCRPRLRNRLPPATRTLPNLKGIMLSEITGPISYPTWVESPKIIAGARSVAILQGTHESLRFRMTSGYGYFLGIRRIVCRIWPASGGRAITIRYARRSSFKLNGDLKSGGS